MDADLELTGETRIEVRQSVNNALTALKTLVRFGGFDRWLTANTTETLAYFAAKRVAGIEWVHREKIMEDLHVIDPYLFYKKVYNLRNAMGAKALIIAAGKQGWYKLDIEKDRIKVDPALSQHPDWRVRHLFLID